MSIFLSITYGTNDTPLETDPMVHTPGNPNGSFLVMCADFTPGKRRVYPAFAPAYVREPVRTQGQTRVPDAGPKRKNRIFSNLKVKSNLLGSGTDMSTLFCDKNHGWFFTTKKTPLYHFVNLTRIVFLAGKIPSNPSNSTITHTRYRAAPR